MGKPLSEETKRKISLANTGRKHSEESKEKMRNLAYGRKHSEETKKKISQVQIGKHISEETKKKMSISQQGRVTSEETKRKIKESNIGQKRSMEARKKMSEAKLGGKSPAWKGGYTKKGIPLYDTFASQISWCDPVRRDLEDNNILQTKCTYCGKWYTPIVRTIYKRIAAINGKCIGENKLYCSKECKHLCPVYHKIKYSAEETNTKQLSREVQPELRQMVFARDNWTCKKCANLSNLQCHHIEGIRWEPLESVDIDKCITLCKNCHVEVHKIEGCGYNDMRCN